MSACIQSLAWCHKRVVASVLSQVLPQKCCRKCVVTMGSVPVVACEVYIGSRAHFRAVREIVDILYASAGLCKFSDVWMNRVLRKCDVMRARCFVSLCTIEFLSGVSQCRD